MKQVQEFIVIDNMCDGFVADLSTPCSKRDIIERFTDLYNDKDDEITEVGALDFAFIQENWEVTIYAVRPLTDKEQELK